MNKNGNSCLDNKQIIEYLAVQKERGPRTERHSMHVHRPIMKKLIDNSGTINLLQSTSTNQQLKNSDTYTQNT
jgi:hypothetical protein